MGIEETLTTIDSLVAKSEQGVFVERELFPLVYELIKDPSSLPEEKLPQTEDLFHRIAATHKSTYHGYNFYNKLLESSLPFVHQVFERAVYTEPYYNCKPEALFGYLITTLQKNGYENEEMFDFLNLRSGDIREYLGQPLDLTLLPEEDSPKIKKALIHFLDDGGHHATWSGLVASIIFPFPEVQSKIVGSLRVKMREIEEVMGAPQQQDDNWHIFGNPSMMAKTLYYIRGEEGYKQMGELLSSCYTYRNHLEKWNQVQERVRDLAANLLEQQ